MAYDRESVQKQVQENMPSLSPTAAKVMQLANNINTPPAELTKVIKMDAVLSAKVLRLVNSSYFALSNRIVSLEKAVILLGLNTIKNLALSAAVLTKMEEHAQANALNSQIFWKHSLSVGVVARFIADKRGISRKLIEDYFLAGLMHDLGYLIVTQIFWKETVRINHMSGTQDMLSAENEVMEGLNHCIIGSILADKWNLSPDLKDVIEEHHNINCQSEHKELVLSVLLANEICKRNEVGLVPGQYTMPSLPVPVLDVLGLTDGIEPQAVHVLENEIGKAMEFLKP